MNHATKVDPLALLGKAAAGLRIEALPQEVIQHAKQHVLDTLGCLIAGYHSGIAEAIRSYVVSQGGGAEATLLPGGQKTTASLVCLAHATYMFGLELSDYAPRGTVHPGNKVVPAALALAERANCGGATMLAAIVAGYEIEIRIGRAVFQNAFYRGWWTPGVFGGIGPAVTAGHLSGLDATGLNNAIGIVLNLLPTAMSQVNDEGASIKWLIGGQACATGLLAAHMAARGTTGMRDIVGGWLPVIADEYYPDRLTEGISLDGTITQWEMLSGILIKYDAVPGPLTAALDATFGLITKNDIKADDIAEIHVDCTRRTATFNTRHPENDIAARASLPYCLAVAVCTRDRSKLLGPAFRPEVLTDKAIWAAAEKVRITENPDYDQKYPAHSLSRVTITLRNGTFCSQEEDRAAHRRYSAPTEEDIEEKFRLIATSTLGQKKTDRVIALVRELEILSNVNELVAGLCPLS